MDAFIVDVRKKGIMAPLITLNTLLDQDEWCMYYLSAYHKGKLDLCSS